MIHITWDNTVQVPFPINPKKRIEVLPGFLAQAPC